MKTLNLTSLTNRMNALEISISRQQKYIAKHGKANDAGEYDKQWEQYKKEAQNNLNEWDSMKVLRNNLK